MNTSSKSHRPTHPTHPTQTRKTRIVIVLSDAYRRLLTFTLCLLGPNAAYAIMAALARVLYRLAEPIRTQSEARCRAVFGRTLPPAAIQKMAAQAFVHRAWNLTDLMLARRYLRPSSFGRHGGKIPEPQLSLLLDAQRNRKPVILLTCYYGPYDLLPLLLGYNGIEAAAIYKPHANPQYDAFRNAVRSASGCELVPLHRALVRLPEILESGGAAAILADHVSTKRGVAGQFLGLPMVIPRTVGILAQRYAAIVVVAGMRRRRRAFRFEFVVSDFFDPATWQNHAYPVTYVTHRYIAAMERLILQDPAQYLWTRSRRNVERAARITEGAAIAASGPLAVAGNVDNGARQP